MITGSVQRGLSHLLRIRLRLTLHQGQWAPAFILLRLIHGFPIAELLEMTLWQASTYRKSPSPELP